MSIALLVLLFGGNSHALNTDALDHLADAIRLQTISHQNHEQIDYQPFNAFLTFLRRTYPTVFTQLQVEEIAKYSLLITLPGTDSALKPVLLDAHYDVVPIEPGTEKDWVHPPYAGVVADGYLWGRGAIDDKSSVIAYLEALELLLKQGFAPPRTLLFSIAHDEEISGLDGAANIAARIKERGITLEYMVGEGGQIASDSVFLPDRDLALIALAEKTYVTLSLTARGEGGHSSRPVQDNALAKLSKAVAILHDTPFAPTLISPVTDMLQTIGAEMDGVMGFMLRNQWLSKPFIVKSMGNDPITSAMVRSTTAVTMFSAGVKENVIPQQARAKVNFRLLPGHTKEQLIEDVTTMIGDPDIVIESDNWGSSPRVADMNAIGYRTLKAAILGVLPDAVVAPALLVATSDTPHYSELTDNIYRFQPYTVTMGDVSRIHGTNERISVEGFDRMLELSGTLIRAITSSGPKAPE